MVGGFGQYVGRVGRVGLVGRAVYHGQDALATRGQDALATQGRDALATCERATRRGTALIEMAMVLPVLLLLTLGVIHYGWLFLKAEQLTSAARNGARVMARTQDEGLSNEAIRRVMEASGMRVAWRPSWTRYALDSPGWAWEVSVEVDTSDIALVHASFLPTPPVLRATVDMAED